jgi:YD repeat-containing protein
VFTYSYEAGLLDSIRAPSGKLLRFNYSGGLIAHVIHPNQTTRIYHYEDRRFPSFLTGITDERGIRYATWKYDDQGRAISSEHAGGAEKTSLNFNADGSTTVTNALGKKTTYSFTDLLGVRRVSKVTGEPTENCVGANQNYTYYPDGALETKTDWKGQITKYTYDSFGRELTQTRAFGTADASTVQTCWHETLNQPSRIIEPTRVTLIDYFPGGKIKSQTVKPRPAGTVDCTAAL